jgi:hypothetical protein
VRHKTRTVVLHEASAVVVVLRVVVVLMVVGVVAVGHALCMQLQLAGLDCRHNKR